MHGFDVFLKTTPSNARSDSDFPRLRPCPSPQSRKIIVPFFASIPLIPRILSDDYKYRNAFGFRPARWINGAQLSGSGKKKMARRPRDKETPESAEGLCGMDRLDLGLEEAEYSDRDISVDPSPRILVIDDDEIMRGFVARALEDEYHVWCADSGLDGCLKAGAVKPDIVLVDLLMPDVSGAEVIRTIRAKLADSGVRIIVITGYPLDASLDEARMLGIEGVLNKPFTIEELFDEVYRVEDLEAPSIPSSMIQ